MATQGDDSPSDSSDSDEIDTSFGLADPTVIPEVEDCPVCLEPYYHTGKALKCGHGVHMKCIVESGQSRCPICRREVVIPEKDQKRLVKKSKELYQHNTNTISEADIRLLSR